MIEKIILKKSAVLDKMPTAEQLDFGELAINYNAEHPFLSFKDSDGNITALNDYTDAIKKKLNITDFNNFKADNTKTINALDRNVSQNGSEIQNNTTAIATLNTSIEQKADKTELATKVDNSDIVQNTGQSTTSVMSQKAVSDALSTKVGKTDITQSTGTSETELMSQKAVSDALSNVYTKTESDARYLRVDVLYEDYYYPNMGETTDKVRFTDSTEILQPTKFIGEYTDENGQKYNCVFECDSFPDWFDFAERECYPYGNGISTGIPFFKNYTIDNGEVVYNFDSMQQINIAKKLPHFIVPVGLKKIDDNHFHLYTVKSGTVDFTSFDKENVDCSLFAFSSVTYNPIYDVDDCKLVRITLTGNIKSPSRYSSLLNGSCDVGLIGYINRQVLYGDEYVEIEIDKNNNRWRQIKSGYSMFYRTSHLQNWSANKPESYESECRCLWSNIPKGTIAKICMLNNKVCYSFTHWSNPLTILQMGCKIKIEKLA